MTAAGEVRDLVERYRLASKRWRGLKHDHFGQKNVDFSSRHARVMAEVYVRLQQLGFDALAEQLSVWHQLLRDAPEQLDSVAKKMRGQAIRLALEINEAVAKAGNR